MILNGAGPSAAVVVAGSLAGAAINSRRILHGRRILVFPAIGSRVSRGWPCRQCFELGVLEVELVERAVAVSGQQEAPPSWHRRQRRVRELH